MLYKLILLVLISLIVVPAILFWGSINALIKDVTNQPCTSKDLNYKPWFISPIGIPYIFNRTQYNRFKKCAPIDVYFKDNASEEQISSFLDNLKQNPNIYSVDYRSKKQTTDDYKEINKDILPLLNMPEGDIFPANVRIHINYEENKSRIISDIESNPITEHVIEF